MKLYLSPEDFLEIPSKIQRKLACVAPSSAQLRSDRLAEVHFGTMDFTVIAVRTGPWGY